MRIDTPKEADYYRHGGILNYVLRQLVGEWRACRSDASGALGGRDEDDGEVCVMNQLQRQAAEAQPADLAESAGADDE